MKYCNARAALLGAAVLGLVGCQAYVPPDVEGQGARAAALSEAIVFRSDAGTLDAGGVVGERLTLAEAVRLTAKNDARIQAALGRVRVAEAESHQARLLPNPVMNVSVRFRSGGGSPVIDAGLAAGLVSVLQQPGRVSVADDRLRAETAAAVGTVLDVLTETRERYVAVQTLDELTAILEARRNALARLVEFARARLEAGEGTRLDVTTLEAQEVTLESQIAEKALERRVERLALAKLIGHPSGEVAWAVDGWGMPALPTLGEAEWVEAALRHRPEVRVREFELSALGAERGLTRLAPFQGGTVGVDAERDGGWSVGPGVSVPLPLFDTGLAARERATAAVIEARHKLLDAQREAVEVTRAAYATYQSSRENLERVRTRLVPLQERRRAEAEAQYAAGEVEVTSLYLAEQDLQAARGRMIELQRGAVEALVRLERAVGGSGVVGKDSK